MNSCTFNIYSDNKTLSIDFQGATVFKNEIGRRLRHRTPTSSTCWTTGIFRETADQLSRNYVNVFNDLNVNGDDTSCV